MSLHTSSLIFFTEILISNKSLENKNDSLFQKKCTQGNKIIAKIFCFKFAPALILNFGFGR